MSAFDYEGAGPGQLHLFPEDYRRALSAALGTAPGRVICRPDRAGLPVWDAWDMRPVRRREGPPRNVAWGAQEADAVRAAADLPEAPTISIGRVRAPAVR